MRRMLFRGKDIKGNWHVGLLAHVGNAWYISNRAGVATAYEVIPSTIGQYIGRNDKNNRMIFEDDIVFRNWNGGRAYRIIYDDDYCSFIAKAKNNAFVEFEGDSEYFSIIGNIHDNPELLK